MNKASMTEIVKEITGCTKKNAGKVISLIFDKIKDAVVEGKDVKLIGFGTFTSRPRKAKKGRNPQTTEELIIPATVVPVFKPGKQFKKAVKDNLKK
jgi:DNA-binding protein HU-beta